MSVLVVEDEPSIRENLRSLLEWEGYSVFVAENGTEGIRLLKTIPRPCLVLLDLLMPVMNGMEFLEAKSHDVAIASIPVCVLSGVAEPATSAGVSQFLKKPLEFDLLLKFVRNFCGTPDKGGGRPG